ncbi:filamentous hemagglutinin N-terminal domain-containing protein [Aetokthonos hydrillicola Thurmond2011]|jgi:filamentous hemagglutinin family protein|uniref:Filamentous hemagglutinin N-terminal domain-containing protein n=1 Tax=Aetokthonos hydrillicola Thurmond2011 TaxID=2712845 RepID=A0AAP5IGQ2_9CYAN|nr:filamentous hemagglutinin N-terminal domain-containing protein [Aetokthonos hydrillicola]MBO3460998.1 filamentous hemagglutinin N-terminal domain-containing protein [Aetokthonos hydrillicola CCALA 1050]MBW4588433.1 filamentous hemagglutinin N-terminal domain-containing protein [Aetokthonos hydrillicola CCALA 1050]MDR9900802.1 filamentous hemagglutinin N-terminal domain-containing protein [Aetokthonos hydrillicola Thurmond2011]
MLGRTAIWCRLLGFAIGTYAFSINCAIAQITPDRTLTNNSSVSRTGNIFNITGGTQAGRNLFHSFQSFSVPGGATASFNNGLDISNIISRVTGGSISNIDGLIKANGTANVFLINPAGIVFGQNARLNIGGSFIASTASSLKFADGFVFSATIPETATPLLTISVPTGLQFGSLPGEIVVQGSGAIRDNTQFNVPLLNRNEGLGVPTQTLALVGGKIKIEGGILTTETGRIELGSVSGNGLVSLATLDKGFSLNYAAGTNFDDIQLSKQAAIDALANGGGDIQLTGRRITLTQGSEVKVTTNGAKAGGSLVVNASDSILLEGKSSDSKFGSGFANESDRTATGIGGLLTINARALFLENGGFTDTGSFGSGNSGDLIINSDSVQVSDGGSLAVFNYRSTGVGGNLKINTNQLVIKDGGFVGTSTFSKGSSGDLTINAVDFVHILGSSPNGRNVSGLSTQAESDSTGNAGNLTIKTRELLVQGGAFVNAGTKSSGNAGNLNINADSVEVIGTLPNNIGSALGTQAQPGATGSGGNLTINTRELLIKDGGFVGTDTYSPKRAGDLTVNATGSIQVIGTSTNGSGSALSTQSESTGLSGNLTINTRQLLVRDGAQVNAGLFDSGRSTGGTLTVNATDSITVIGKSLAGKKQSSSLSSIVETTATGLAGDVNIFTRNLILRDEGKLSVENRGSGAAGKLQVQAGSIYLDNGAVIQGTSSSGTGGDISLQVSDLLLMRRGSQISTSAGTLQQGGGNGGSITISSPNGFVIAAKGEKNRITANAFDGSGGVIKINTLGIYNFNRPNLEEIEKLLGTKDSTKLDPQQLTTNDITAFSQTSPTLSGTVKINTPDIDPSRGLVVLSTISEVAPKLISSSCAAFDEAEGGSQFIWTGRGGLPSSPFGPLTSDAIWRDTRIPATTTPQDLPNKVPVRQAIKAKPIVIIPATGWVFNGKGEVTLISSIPNATGSGSTPPSCPTR